MPTSASQQSDDPRAGRRVDTDPPREALLATPDDPLADLAFRIAQFDRGADLGECLADSTSMVRDLAIWLVVGVVAWAAFFGLVLS